MATFSKRCVKIYDAIGVGQFLRPVVRCFREERECYRRIVSLLSCGRQIKEYLKNNASKKLHLRASDKILPGWLNTDLQPSSLGSVFMDATKPFPLPSESFDYVFCEHFIEHISLDGATCCFAEVFRCLKRGGIFRLATPDLHQYVGLFSESLRPDQIRFLELFGAFFKLDRVSPCLALNHLIYNWGHRFLYTREELLDHLKRAGFAEVVAKPVGESNHPALCGIEHHARFYGNELNRFETMVFEANK